MPPDAPPRIFDRSLVARRRARAASSFADHAFLKREVAERLAERLDPILRRFPLALDLGAHDGALSASLAGRGGIERVIKADLSPALLAAGSGARVAVDEEWLPFADESVDLVVSALSLHWVNDLPGALVQINRALKPDGLFLGATFGPATLRELREAFAQAEIEVLGGVSPRVSPFLDAGEAAGLLQRARFALPVADSETITVTYADPLALLMDLRGMGETNALIERRRAPMGRALLGRMLALYRERWAGADGRVPATFEIVTLTGWAPHESQQKPLPRGSATMRLADALGRRPGGLKT